MSSRGLNLAIPWPVALALAAFFCLHAVCILNIRGVADPEGYRLNTAKPFGLNSYEDDGTVTMLHALGHVHEVRDTFSIGTNFGGPLLHAAKPVLWLAAKLGIYQRFDDPALYALYPGELTKAWQVFGFFKLCLLLGLPLALYWILANFASRWAGILACWLASLHPASFAFEMRMKPDGVVLALTLFVLLLLLEYMRSRTRRHLFLAGGLLGLALSMKFTMAVAAPLFLVCFVAANRRAHGHVSRQAWADLVRTAGIGLAAFVLGNPLLLAAPAIFTEFVGRYTAIPNNPDVSQGFWHTVWFRLRHFEPFLGQAANVLVLPALAVLAWRAAIKRFALDAPNLILALFALNFGYLWLVAHNHVVQNLTYYYYGQSLLLLALLACALDQARTWFGGGGAARLGANLLAVGLLAGLTGQALDVVRFMSGPSTRQEAHAWVRDHVPAGASIGVPTASAENHVQFSERILVDPFRHPLAQLGPDASGLSRCAPDYLLWSRSTVFQPLPDDPRYRTVAEFDSGNRLPRETFNLHQDDHYRILKRADAAPAEACPAPNAGELFLAAHTPPAPEGFTVLQYRALGQLPLAMGLVLRGPDGFLPLPPGVLLAAYRPADFPAQYVHQLPPEALTLWGVRYVLARQDDALLTDTLGSPRYGLTLLAGPVRTPGGPVALYENTGYRGRAFFLPDPPPGNVSRQTQRWGGLLARHRLKSYGTLSLAGPAGASRPDLLRVRLTVEATGRMDLLLKGAAVQSVILAPGRTVVDLPLALGTGAEAGYEINPVDSGASCRVLSLEVAPMALRPVPGLTSLDLSGAFAGIEAPTSGEVAFALPWHPFWKADVDGRPTPPKPGPAGTVCVPVDAGSHFVRLFRNP